MKLPLRPTPAALIFLCALIGADLLYQLAAPAAEIQGPHVALRPQAARPPATQPFNPPPIGQFSEIDERSVFNPTREAVFSPATAGDAGAGTPSDFALVGIIMGAERRIAVVKTPGAASALNLAVGDTINAWRITRIEPDYIVVQGQGSHDVKVPLQASGHAAATAAPEQDGRQ